MPRRRSLAAPSRLPGWFRTCRDRRPVLGLVRDDERPSLAPDLASSRSRRPGRPVSIAGMRRANRNANMAAGYMRRRILRPRWTRPTYGVRSSARDPPRRSCGPATGAGSAHGAKLVTSTAHDLTSACSCRAVPWAAPAPSSLRVDVVSCVRSSPDPVPLRDPPRNGEPSPSRPIGWQGAFVKGRPNRAETGNLLTRGNFGLARK